MIFSYERFIEQKIYEYIDYSINEEVSFESIKKRCLSVIEKAKCLSYSAKKRVLIYLLTSLMTISAADKIIDAFHQTKDPVAVEVIDQKFNFKDPLTLSISDNGINHIKEEEKLRLKAYKIGDGKITVGYGHAEDLNKTKLRVGSKISIETANKLLQQDIKKAEGGIKRIFNDWKNQGIERKITQDQYDALVSMAFNMGISGLRKSNFIKELKSGNLTKAGEIIKKTNIDDSFPGLEKRRLKESSMFLSYLSGDSYPGG